MQLIHEETFTPYPFRSDASPASYVSKKIIVSQFVRCLGDWMAVVVVEIRSAEDFSIIYTYDGKEIFLDKSLKYFLPNVKMPKKGC